MLYRRKQKTSPRSPARQEFYIDEKEPPGSKPPLTSKRRTPKATRKRDNKL